MKHGGKKEKKKQKASISDKNSYNFLKVNGFLSFTDI